MKNKLGAYSCAIRPHQWLKNFLVFVPAIAGHEFHVRTLAVLAAVFVSFSACASANYLFNDLWDLQHDRQHPTKKQRPLASGQISIRNSLMLAVFLLMASFAIAAAISVQVVGILLLYLTMTSAYTLYLKKKVAIDPAISGKQVRFRSPESIVAELKECYHTYGIRNFFFKSDTFTIDATWVRSVCDAIINSDLAGKISWVANSRVKPLAEDTLKIMRDAGCWLVAFGFESGNPDTLKKIKKGATVEDNLRAARLAKQAGLKLFGFFLVGLPWEDASHLADTRKHIFDIDADFIEVHIAVPYYGTELYQLTKEAGLIDGKVLGKDYFNGASKGTLHIPIEQITAYRQQLVLAYHLRPSYIGRKMVEALTKPVVLGNYIRFGSRLLLSNLKASRVKQKTALPQAA